MARAMANSAVNPAPLSDTPGPCNRPSGPKKIFLAITDGENRIEVRGQGDVRAFPILDGYATTLPARSILASKWSAWNCASSIRRGFARKKSEPECGRAAGAAR